MQLMLRVQQGDDAAFDELVRRNVNKVYALVYHFLGNDDLADDLSQEVFLRIYRTAGRYKPTAKFSTWLYRIVANLSFNVMRSRKRRRVWQFGQAGTQDEDDPSETLPDVRAGDPSEALDDDELHDQVATAIAKLPHNQRVALVLHQYEHKSYEEIADVMDCSLMAVKSLLSRARQHLRQSLGRYLDR
ncbi:MAG: sigma-70 family RNA polymerase sigma factor [Phycisphaerae bacterium]|nr:sigma-70 family RNA polymerase sigma factor [Phycisphaerae bacterium]